MLRKIIKLLLIICWMGVIFTFSNDNIDQSMSKSDKVIVDTYEVVTNKDLTKSEEKKVIKTFMYPVRKGAHFTEYLILGVLIISFVSEFYAISGKSLIITIILCMLYASGDEIHQIFSSGRTPMVLDVIIDTCGSATGALIYSYIGKKFLRRKIYE